MSKRELFSGTSVRAYGPRCRHSGPCGTRGHTGSGHGYCQFCKKCN